MRLVASRSVERSADRSDDALAAVDAPVVVAHPRPHRLAAVPRGVVPTSSTRLAPLSTIVARCNTAPRSARSQFNSGSSSPRRAVACPWPGDQPQRSVPIRPGVQGPPDEEPVGWVARRISDLAGSGLVIALGPQPAHAQPRQRGADRLAGHAGRKPSRGRQVHGARCRWSRAGGGRGRALRRHRGESPGRCGQPRSAWSARDALPVEGEDGVADGRSFRQASACAPRALAATIPERDGSRLMRGAAVSTALHKQSVTTTASRDTPQRRPLTPMTPPRSIATLSLCCTASQGWHGN